MAPGRERPDDQAVECSVCATRVPAAIDGTPIPHRRMDFGEQCTGSGALPYVQARRRWAP